MLTGPVVTSTVNIMGQIKNLIENVCDLYENGVEPEAIAFGLEVKVKMVTDIWPIIPSCIRKTKQF